MTVSNMGPSQSSDTRYSAMDPDKTKVLDLKYRGTVRNEKTFEISFILKDLFSVGTFFFLLGY